MTRVEEFNAGMAPDVTSTSSDEDLHGNSLSPLSLGFIKLIRTELEFRLRVRIKNPLPVGQYH